MTTAPDLLALSRPESSAGNAAVPPPRKRWATRVGLPVLILAIAGALLAYSARAALWPRTDVWVVPVVSRPASREAHAPAGPDQSRGPRTAIAQAPGWMEPDPYAINVPALTEGVVREVLVLEGQAVEQGQVVARLIDEDAHLAVQRAEAELAGATAELGKARADVESASSRAAEVRDELTRKKPLLESGGISAGQLARLELRAVAADKEIESARAAVALADANVKRYEVLCAEARLLLSRTEIRSPAAGIVLARLVEPGTRLSMSGAASAGGAMPGTVIRLYDPAHLQARADIPLADAAKVSVGTPAEVTTEALPGKTFTGRVSRLVHEADIQRNTLQVKVAIENPELGAGSLRPEMLARVRFFSRPAEPRDAQPPPAPASQTASAGPVGASDLQLLIPSSAPFKMMGSDMAHVWIADQSGGTQGPVASERQLTVARAEGGQLLVLAGLSPGDRVIVDPPQSLREGSRLRILGEKPEHSDH
jgi:HlyD family secretion protein